MDVCLGRAVYDSMWGAASQGADHHSYDCCHINQSTPPPSPDVWGHCDLGLTLEVNEVLSDCEGCHVLTCDVM